MNGTSLIIGAALAFCSIASVANCEGRLKIAPDDYLYWPKIDYDNQVDFHARIRNALEKLAREKNFYGDGAERLREASRDDRFSAEERDIYWAIYITEIDESCQRQKLDLIQSIWVQMDDDKFPAILKQTLKNVCAISMLKCHDKRSSEKLGLIDIDVEKQLDRTFAAAFDMQYDDADYQFARFKMDLTSALRKFDPAEDKFNAKQMVVVMRELSSNDESSWRENPSDLLKGFMLSRCDRFDEKLRVTLAIWGLMGKFGMRPHWGYPDLERMREYDRLCRALKSCEKQKPILENFETQLSKKAHRGGLARILPECLRCQS